MDLLQLQYFCTIAQYENITKAAKALFVLQLEAVFRALLGGDPNLQDHIGDCQIIILCGL